MKVFLKDDDEWIDSNLAIFLTNKSARPLHNNNDK